MLKLEKRLVIVGLRMWIFELADLIENATNLPTERSFLWGMKYGVDKLGEQSILLLNLKTIEITRGTNTLIFARFHRITK